MNAQVLFTSEKIAFVKKFNIFLLYVSISLKFNILLDTTLLAWYTGKENSW